MTELTIPPAESREARLLHRAQEYQRRTRLPMFVLSLAMIALVSIHVAAPPSGSAGRQVSLAEWFIWALFVAEFLVGLFLTPRKLRFLRDNWIMTLALILPVLRILHFLKLVGALPDAPAYELLAVAYRGMSKIASALAERQLLHVLAVIAVIIFTCGAAEHLVEHGAPGANIVSYGDSIWWAAGTMSTVGTELYPVTSEGRIIAVFTMLAGVSVIGYTAATLATLFIRPVAAGSVHHDEPHVASELAAVRDELRRLEASFHDLARLIRDRPAGRELPG